MEEKDLNEIKNTIDDLDKKITRDNAVVQFDMYGGCPDESRIQANQKGYLRLGIEFLKAAFAPRAKDTTDDKIIDVDIGYLTSKKTEIRFDWFERRDDIQLPPEPYKHGGFKDSIFLVITAIVLIIVVAFIIMGIVGIITVFG